MKRFYYFTVLLLLAATVGFSQGIVGSEHDFSTEGWGTTEVCEACHTPHNADVSVIDSPLWNHEVTTSTFVLYSSATLDATMGQPDGVSKLCLSCHDGTVALDNFGGNTNGNVFIGSGDLIGLDLSSEHPISFTYDALLATNDGGLYDPTTTNSGLGNTISSDLLFSNNLECASCHDVHNAEGNSNLLRINNNGSALCLTCHNK